MKLKFVNVLFALCTIGSLTRMPIANAMQADDYFEKVGLPVKPLKIEMNDKITAVGDDITKRSLSEFSDFQNNYQKLQHKFENELADYMIIKSYILDVLKIPCDEFYKFESSIGKPGNIPPHMKRMLAVPLDTLASVLSSKTSIPVTLNEIETYLSNEKLKGCQEFEVEHHEKKDRILLRSGIEAFFKQKNIKIPLSLQSAFVSETLCTNGTTQSFPTIKKGYDISAVFAEQSHNFLTSLPFSMDPIITNRFRVFDRFIICRQLDCFLKEDKMHPELYQHSLVTVKDGLLYQDGHVLNTTNAIWSLNSYGDLCISPENSTLFGGIHHSFFFQKDNIGLPLACGGHIDVLNGKISKITNVSGHYEPSLLQLVLAIAYFHEKGVVAQDLTTDAFGTFQTLTLNNILSIAAMTQLTD